MLGPSRQPVTFPLISRSILLSYGTILRMHKKVRRFAKWFSGRDKSHGFAACSRGDSGWWDLVRKRLQRME
jgi:hypothetical protein